VYNTADSVSVVVAFVAVVVGKQETTTTVVEKETINYSCFYLLVHLLDYLCD
jgi:hypothetical protein